MRFLHLHVPLQVYTDIFQLIWLILFKRAAGVINPYPLSWKGIFQQHRLQFFGNMSKDPEPGICAEPADGFHKALCSWTNKTKPTSLPSVTSPRRNLQVWDFHMPKLITFSIHTGSWELWDYLMCDYSTLCQHFYSEYKNSIHFLGTIWTSKVKMYNIHYISTYQQYHCLPTLVLMKNGPRNSQKWV